MVGNTEVMPASDSFRIARHPPGTRLHTPDGYNLWAPFHHFESRAGQYEVPRKEGLMGAKTPTATKILVVACATLLTCLAYAASGRQGRSQRVPQSAANAAQAGEVKVNPKDGLKYVWIPPGIFTMGCSPGDSECSGAEKPAHQVSIRKGFWIGQTAVTVGAYKRFTAATGKDMPSAPSFNADWRNENMPIVNVSWNDSQAYCQWSGGRLPTEAEWEYAARGGSSEARYGPLDEVAWYADNSGRQRLDSTEISKSDSANYVKRLNDNGNGTHDVAQKRANGFGLYDTLGNVWQWVGDWYDANYYQSSPSSDPPGPSSGQYRVLRGGSWLYIPRVVRVSYRLVNGPAVRYGSYGFRCVGEANIP